MQKSSYSVGMIGTILVHLVAILLFLEFSPNYEARQQSNDNAVENLVDVTLLSEADEDSTGTSVEPLYTADGKRCPPGSKTYLGMGVVYDMVTGEILEAPRMLPAFRAGIRVGDLMLNNPIPDATNMMIIYMLRGHAQLAFEVKATQICYSLDPLVSV